MRTECKKQPRPPFNEKRRLHVSRHRPRLQQYSCRCVVIPPLVDDRLRLSVSYVLGAISGVIQEKGHPKLLFSLWKTRIGDDVGLRLFVSRQELRITLKTLCVQCAFLCLSTQCCHEYLHAPSTAGDTCPAIPTCTKADLEFRRRRNRHRITVGYGLFVYGLEKSGKCSTAFSILVRCSPARVFGVFCCLLVSAPTQVLRSRKIRRNAAPLRVCFYHALPRGFSGVFYHFLVYCTHR